MGLPATVSRGKRIKQKRLTQVERSKAMRRRLLDATLKCLVTEGYAAMTVSSIVRRAGVSRGAQVHHYPNKQALLVDAAGFLVQRTYRKLGELLLSIAEEENRLQALVDAVWEQLFCTPLYHAYAELQTASRRDRTLATAMRGLLLRIQNTFDPAVDHYFEAIPGAEEEPRALFMQLGCILAGLGSQLHVMDNNPGLRAPLSLWTRQASRALRARKGVSVPPPRPAALDIEIGLGR